MLRDGCANGLQVRGAGHGVAWLGDARHGLITASCARILATSMLPIHISSSRGSKATQHYQKGESTILFLGHYSYLHRNMVSTYKQFLVPEIFFM